MNIRTSLDKLKSGLNLSTTTDRNSRPSIPVQQAFYDFEMFPEYKDFTTMVWYYEKQGYTKNQFLAHIGASDATVKLNGRSLINFSSYNYLALANHPRIKAAAKRAIDDFGTSTGAGRSITGEVDLHAQFENELCEVLQCEDAVVSVGGYSTNAFSIAYLARPQDLIVYDELIHNSALAGCKMTTAKRFSFPHNDYNALERILASHRDKYERVFILTEGVYSMDGDIPDIPRLISVKNRFKCLLMVDEAHSMGVIGPQGLGVTDYFGIPGHQIDILFGSMSKSFGTCGGYIAGPKPLIAILKNYAPGILLYGAAPTPANTAAGLETLRMMREHPELALRVQSNAAYFIQRAKAEGLDTHQSKDSGVVPIMMRDSELALWLSIQLFDAGICSFPMLFPIVPRDKSRLRFFVNTNHTKDQIDYTIDTMAKMLKVAPKSKGVM